MPVRGLPNIVHVARAPRGKRLGKKARLEPPKPRRGAAEPEPTWARRR